MASQRLSQIARLAPLLSAFALMPARAEAQQSWVMLGNRGETVVRHLIEQEHAECPKLKVRAAEEKTAREHPMHPRFTGGLNFPITVCEATFSPTQRGLEASIGETHLPMPKAQMESMVVLGDTGCRVNKVAKKKEHKEHDQKGQVEVQPEEPEGGGLGEDKPTHGKDDVDQDDEEYKFQDCAEEDQWPFPKIVQAAADKHPDLVVHVGDYIYRKAPCPAPEKCGSAAFGTTYATFKAEFLEAAKPLLAAAPWVAPRGNHENCDLSKIKTAQGGMAFFILFDPRPLATVTSEKDSAAYLQFLDPMKKEELPPESGCTESTPPYVVPVSSGLDLWVLDSNEPGDTVETAEKKPTLVGKFTGYFRALQKQSKAGTAFLVTHRPLFALYPGKRADIKEGDSNPQPKEMNVVLQRAFLAAKPDKLKLTMAGHMHLFQSVAFDDRSLPPTLVVGNSGTALDSKGWDTPVLQSKDGRFGGYQFKVGGHANEAKAITGLTVQKFGFLYLAASHTKAGESWPKALLLDQDGKELLECTLPAGTCAQAEPRDDGDK